MSTPHLPSPPRGPQCPPAALLEAMSAGEPAPAPAEAHVKACAACSAHVAELASAREAFVRQKPADLFLKQLQRREAAAAAAPQRTPWQRFLPLLATVVPLALLTVVGVRVWNRDATVDPHDPGGYELKGDRFKVTALREGAEPVQLEQDMPVRAGDRLRFAYVAPKDGYLLVLELDGAGQASVFHPFGAMLSAPHPGKSQDFVKGSVQLDATPGTSFLFAVFSEKPLEAAAMLNQLRAQAGETEPRVDCDGCRVERLRLRKVAAP